MHRILTLRLKLSLVLIYFLYYITSPFLALASHQDLEFTGEYEISSGSRLTNCENELQSLIGRVENLERAVSEIKSSGGTKHSSRDEVASNAHNLQAATSHDTMQPLSVIPNESSTGKDVTSEKQHYDLALVALKDQKFEDAENRFAEFIAKYPKSAVLSNAYFWYGESFFRRGNFEKAAINYLKCYKQFPKAAKASDALLKLALSLGEMKKTKEACAMLAKLEQEFKDRPAASIKRSRDAKNKYGCK
ncbi:MAG: tol-pal system protein YbgF [Pseudomonadota bacterium]